ncbi:MAG TPA: hypothetical protein PK990_03390, partial [Salinivirgaceae bacterium]|nr:hypothetical protein [Salinivirgaceae bacterium]
DAVARSYVYQISQRRTAFFKDFCWWVKEPLDVQKMQKSASVFEGMHDFASFGETEKPEESTLVKIDRVSVHSQGDGILIHIVGSHFLGKMVRRMVGTLVEVGKGKISINDVQRFLTESSEFPAQHTAPPSGLFLERVYYPGEKISDTPTTLYKLNSLSR